MVIWTVIVGLILFWFLGLISGIGSFAYVLLIAALVLMLINLIVGPRST